MLSVIRDDDGKIADFRFEYVNPRGATMVNRTIDTLTGLRLLDVLPGARSSGIFDLLVHVAETGEPTDREIEYAMDGGPGWFRNLVVRVGNGVCVSFSDITRTKRLESDLRQRAAELQKADANKSQFLAVLSHELRNPLAPLMNGLTLLGMLRDPKAVEDTRTMMERQIMQLRRLIDDLLDVSRIDRGKLELVKERVAMDLVIRNAVETAQPNIQSRSQELVVRYAPEPLYVEGDAVRLSQIVANLLNNAAKFTPPRGRIEVSLSCSESQALVAVKDTGIGFDPADARRVFDMFVQLDASREASTGGLGLGLTLVRWLVQMHGGSIEARSAGLGKGAEFVVRLPRAKAPLAALQADVSAPRSYARRRVLVVDDNEDARETLAQILSLEGFDVRACRDGMEALQTAREFKPDVAFIDLNMPYMSGTQLAAKLRSEPWGRTIRLVALTGMGQQSDIESTAAAGFYVHLTKPTSPEEVLRLAGEVGNVLPLPTRKR
jgi:two-component system CheB/CheR fusion protein